MQNSQDGYRIDPDSQLNPRTSLSASAEPRGLAAIREMVNHHWRSSDCPFLRTVIFRGLCGPKPQRSYVPRSECEAPLTAPLARHGFIFRAIWREWCSCSALRASRARAQGWPEDSLPQLRQLASHNCLGSVSFETVTARARRGTWFPASNCRKTCSSASCSVLSALRIARLDGVLRYWD